MYFICFITCVFTWMFTRLHQYFLDITQYNKNSSNQTHQVKCSGNCVFHILSHYNPKSSSFHNMDQNTRQHSLLYNVHFPCYKYWRGRLKGMSDYSGRQIMKVCKYDMLLCTGDMCPCRMPGSLYHSLLPISQICSLIDRN